MSVDISPELIRSDTLAWDEAEGERGRRERGEGREEMEDIITWGVPQTELDPLRVDLEAGRVVLEHGGDVALQEGGTSDRKPSH